MAFKIGSNTVIDNSRNWTGNPTGGTFFRQASEPSGSYPDGSMWIDSDNNVFYIYSSITATDTEQGVTSPWRKFAASGVDVTAGLVSYKYRDIYAHSFTGMGYKSGSPWRNVNQTVHATDITTNLGDKFDRSQGYIDGGWDDTSEIMYGHGAGNQQGGSHNYTSSYNMRTNTQLGGAANMGDISRADAGVSCCLKDRTAYIGGGGNSNMTKMSYTTNTATFVKNWDSGVGGNMSSAAWGDDITGWHHNGGSAYKIDFATDTKGTWSKSYGSNECQKMQSSKDDVMLVGRNGDCGSDEGFDEYSTVDGSWRWVGTKPHDDVGEENFSHGQDHGYCIGLFDGSNQTNASWYWHFNNRSGYQLGSAGIPKGHDGMSSGFGASRKG